MLLAGVDMVYIIAFVLLTTILYSLIMTFTNTTKYSVCRNLKQLLAEMTAIISWNILASLKLNLNGIFLKMKHLSWKFVWRYTTKSVEIYFWWLCSKKTRVGKVYSTVRSRTICSCSVVKNVFAISFQKVFNVGQQYSLMVSPSIFNQKKSVYLAFSFWTRL